MPVIVLAGEEDLSLSRRLEQLKSTLLAPQWRVVNFVKLHKPSLAAINEAASTIPFGQGKRIVLVENCDFFTKKRSKTEETDDVKTESAKTNKKNKSDSPTNDDLETIVASVPETTYLIFSCPYNFDSSLKLSKAVAQYAQIEEFPKEKYFPGSKNLKLEAFCRQEAKKYNATIDDAALQYLLTSAEGDLRQIASEIEKTSLAVLPKTIITYDVVVNFCSPQGHIFQFIDFWLAGQTGQALDNLKELLAQQNAMPILATLQTMLSKWIKVKALYEQYSDPPTQSGKTTSIKPSNTEIAKQIAADLKLMPFSIEKDLQRLKKHTASDLVDKRLQLTRLEYAIKVGQLPGDHALTMFVASK